MRFIYFLQYSFILVNTEERKCLCSVFPGGVHSINNQANQGTSGVLWAQGGRTHEQAFMMLNVFNRSH